MSEIRCRRQRAEVDANRAALGLGCDPDACRAPGGERGRDQVRTTILEPADRKVPDLLKRAFTAEAPNQRYVGDITYLLLADGHSLYLATVIDCYSRSLAGWTVADHLRTELVEDALQAAADVAMEAGRGVVSRTDRFPTVDPTLVRPARSGRRGVLRNVSQSRRVPELDTRPLPDRG